MTAATSFDTTGPVTGTTASAGVLSPGLEWDLAEGSTLPGFQEYITIQNPSAQEARVSMTYGLEGAAGRAASVVVAPRSRTTVDVNRPDQAGPGQTGVSARVQSTNGVPILVERPIYFAHDFGSGTPIDGGHVAAGVLPQTMWSFAEGNVLPGWFEFVTLYNPGSDVQSVSVDYLLEGAPPQHRTYSVPAGARRTVQVFTDSPDEGIGRNPTPAASKGVSVQVSTTGTGVVAERPVYAQAAIGDAAVNDGHVAVGAVATEDCSEFAGGDTVGPDATFLTLANPSSSAVDVAIGIYPAPGDGSVKSVNRTIAANGRLTVDLSSIIDGEVFGVDVVGLSGARFIAEEPLYAIVTGASDAGAALLPATSC